MSTMDELKMKNEERIKCLQRKKLSVFSSQAKANIYKVYLIP